jgi:hypothetical protein
MGSYIIYATINQKIYSTPGQVPNKNSSDQISQQDDAPMWQGSRLISLTINGRITQPIPLNLRRNYVPSAFTQDDSPAWYPTADNRERNILYLLTHQGRRLEPMVVRKGTCAALFAKPRSPSPTIRYTGRCSPIIRRENQPDKSYLRRSGRPAPLSGPCSQMLR